MWGSVWTGSHDSRLRGPSFHGAHQNCGPSSFGACSDELWRDFICRLRNLWPCKNTRLTCQVEINRGVHNKKTQCELLHEAHKGLGKLGQPRQTLEWNDVGWILMLAACLHPVQSPIWLSWNGGGNIWSCAEEEAVMSTSCPVTWSSPRLDALFLWCRQTVCSIKLDTTVKTQKSHHLVPSYWPLHLHYR